MLSSQRDQVCTLGDWIGLPSSAAVISSIIRKAWPLTIVDQRLWRVPRLIHAHKISLCGLPSSASYRLNFSPIFMWSLYNYGPWKRWISKIVNQRWGYFPEGFSPREITPARLTILIFTDFKGRNCFIIPNKQWTGISYAVYLCMYHIQLPF